MPDRTPTDGLPFYCATCGAGLAEYMACEDSDCCQESLEEARRRLGPGPAQRAARALFDAAWEPVSIDDRNRIWNEGPDGPQQGYWTLVAKPALIAAFPTPDEHELGIIAAIETYHAKMDAEDIMDEADAVRAAVDVYIALARRNITDG